MRSPGDAEDPARRKYPVLFVGAVARPFLELGQHAAEGDEVLLLRHLARLAQLLEEVPQVRPPGKPGRIDLHEIGKGRIEEAEPAIPVEYGKADRQVGES